MFENEPELFWKNFRLGTELDISGSFIYNALWNIDKLKHFYYHHEIFEFLYNASIGIERMFKICIILLEHNTKLDQLDFEESLKTHDHLKLLSRLKKLTGINLGRTHNKFLKLLSDFYHKTRYDRFTLDSVFRKVNDRVGFVKFLEEELGISISTDFMKVTPNDKRIKNFIGKLLIKITSELYRIIYERSNELQIYTYEIASDSKAFKILISKEHNFEKEKRNQREILVYFINSKKGTKLHQFISNLNPIKLDDWFPNKYIEYMFDPEVDRRLMPELTYHYEDEGINERERNPYLEAIGSEICFEQE